MTTHSRKDSDGITYIEYQGTTLVTSKDADPRVQERRARNHAELTAVFAKLRRAGEKHPAVFRVPPGVPLVIEGAEEVSPLAGKGREFVTTRRRAREVLVRLGLPRKEVARRMRPSDWPVSHFQVLLSENRECEIIENRLPEDCPDDVRKQMGLPRLK